MDTVTVFARSFTQHGLFVADQATCHMCSAPIASVPTALVQPSGSVTVTLTLSVSKIADCVVVLQDCSGS